MRGLLAPLVTTGIALTAGFIGYQIGLAQTVAATTGAVGWMGGWGVPGFGFRFFLRVIGFLVFACSGRRLPWSAGRGTIRSRRLFNRRSGDSRIPTAAGRKTYEDAHDFCRARRSAITRRATLGGGAS